MVSIFGHHNHDPIPSRVNRHTLRNEIKNTAINTENAPRRIIFSALNGVNQNVLNAVGSASALKQVINRERRASVDPNTITEPALQIDNEHMYTIRGARFYQFGPNFLRSISEKTKICLFYDNDLISIFKSMKIWSIDGTFDVCPNGWSQLYTISFIIDHHIYPFIYALSP